MKKTSLIFALFFIAAAALYCSTPSNYQITDIDPPQADKSVEDIIPDTIDDLSPEITDITLEIAEDLGGEDFAPEGAIKAVYGEEQIILTAVKCLAYIDSNILFEKYSNLDIGTTDANDIVNDEANKKHYSWYTLEDGEYVVWVLDNWFFMIKAKSSDLLSQVVKEFEYIDFKE